MKQRLNAVIAMLLTVLLLGAASPLTGSFALQDAKMQAQGYLRSTPVGGDVLHERLDFWMTPRGSNAVITKYTVDMTKLLHVIVISDDFKVFMHLHPQLGGDGHFTLDQRFGAKALYHIYADAEPTGLGDEVFRFDLPLGSAAKARVLTRTGKSIAAGPYTVNLSGTTLHAGFLSMLVVHVLKNGKPATDLHPYLGMLAHAVFIDGRDLTYTHVHPMSFAAMDMAMPMNGSGEMEMKPLPENSAASPDMMLHVKMHEAGMYKLWLQFRGGNDLYVAPFTINVR